MALVKCPECGREISNKAVSCPGCGYPVEKILEARIELEVIADEICEKYLSGEERTNAQWVSARRELQKRTGLGFKAAMDLLSIRRLGKSRKEVRTAHKQELKELNREANAKIINSLQGLSNVLSKDKTVRCPKCGSTSISYTNKKLSLGRAIAGDTVAGPAGAVLGGLSSKKGYAVCLKCGKQWKI